MHLMYYLDKDGKRVYTLKKSNPEGTATVSAHPGTIISWLAHSPPPALRILEPSSCRTSVCHTVNGFVQFVHLNQFRLPHVSPIYSAARFSPDDKFSRQRVTLKKRFGILPTQQPPREY